MAMTADDNCYLYSIHISFLPIPKITKDIAFQTRPVFLAHHVQGGPKKVKPLRLKAQIFACPHLQNARTCMINFMNMESTDVFRITALK